MFCKHPVCKLATHLHAGWCGGGPLWNESFWRRRRYKCETLCQIFTRRGESVSTTAFRSPLPSFDHASLWPLPPTTRSPESIYKYTRQPPTNGHVEISKVKTKCAHTSPVLRSSPAPSRRRGGAPRLRRISCRKIKSYKHVVLCICICGRSSYVPRERTAAQVVIRRRDGPICSVTIHLLGQKLKQNVKR